MARSAPRHLTGRQVGANGEERQEETGFGEVLVNERVECVQDLGRRFSREDAVSDLAAYARGQQSRSDTVARDVADRDVADAIGRKPDLAVVSTDFIDRKTADVYVNPIAPHRQRQQAAMHLRSQLQVLVSAPALELNDPASTPTASGLRAPELEHQVDSVEPETDNGLLGMRTALRPLVVLSLAIAMTGAALAECVTEDLTPEQKACCAAMGHDCGAAGAEMGCCPTEPQPQDRAQVTGVKPDPTPPAAMTGPLALPPDRHERLGAVAASSFSRETLKLPDRPAYLLLSVFLI